MNPTLASLQSAFQTFILRDPEQLASDHMGMSDVSQVHAWVSDSAGPDLDVRLRIYQDAYRLRLREALREAYPKTHTYLGDDLFAQVSLAYIERHPSHFRNLRWFGAELATLLAQWLGDYPVAAELARFEWALGLAFDAPDQEPLGSAALHVLSAEDWAEVGFKCVPSLHIMPCHTNAPAIWMALAAEQEPPEARYSDQAEHWFIWRKDLQSHFRSVSAVEAMGLEMVRQGASFARMCEQFADQSDESVATETFGTWLHAWLSEGMLGELTYGGA